MDDLEEDDGPFSWSEVTEGAFNRHRKLFQRLGNGPEECPLCYAPGELIYSEMVDLRICHDCIDELSGASGVIVETDYDLWNEEEE